MLADRGWCKSSHLDEMFLVTSEQIALPALRKRCFFSVLPEHLQKVMQRGAVVPPITDHS